MISRHKLCQRNDILQVKFRILITFVAYVDVIYYFCVTSKCFHGAVVEKD